jgi:hypothetical protein
MSKSQKAPEAVPEKTYLKISKTIRIAVTGDVLLTGLETAIIDTPDFQRLRGVRQLGSVNLVYPTALHTRFDHSLGTLAMADRMIRAIRNNTHNEGDEKKIEPIQEALIRLYALLHDVPHVPFGHTIEDELGIFTRHDKNPDRFERFFGEASDIGKLIKEHLGPYDPRAYERFKAIYRWNGKFETDEAEGGNKFDDNETEHQRRERLEKERVRREILKSIKDNDDAFIYDLVSNTVCADLLDYLQRDSYFCNLGLGLEYRFLNYLYLKKDENSGKRRVFVRLWKTDHPEPRRDTLTDLVRLLEARYIVAERAYFHHAKIISGAMLGRAIQEANSVDGGGLREENLYGYSDDILLYELSRSENETTRRLAGGFKKRKLFKVIDKLTDNQFEAAQGQDHAQDAIGHALSLVGAPAKRRKFENRLASEIGARPGDVLIYAPERGMNLKAAEMKVFWKGHDLCLKDVSDPVIEPKLQAILKAHRMLWAIYLIANKTELSDEQLSYLKKSFRVKLLSAETPDDKPCSKEEQELYESYIDLRLPKMNVRLPEDPKAFYRHRAAAAKELSKLKSEDDESWLRQSEEVIEKSFAAYEAEAKAESEMTKAGGDTRPGAQARAGLKSKIVLELRPAFKRYGRQSWPEIEAELSDLFEKNRAVLEDIDEDEQDRFLTELRAQVEDTPVEKTPASKIQHYPGEKPWSGMIENLNNAIEALQKRPKLPYKDE